MKRRMSMCILIFLLLLAALVLNGCSGDKSETSVLADSEDLGYDYVPVKRQSVLGEARLEDCTLTIHYDYEGVYRFLALSYTDLLDEDTMFTFHVSVPGSELVENKQFLELIEFLDAKTLPPVQETAPESAAQMLPTVYYILTNQDGEKLFEVGIGWDNIGNVAMNSVYFNFEKIPFNVRFYYSVEPYMTEPHYLPGAIPSQGNG